MQLTDFFTWQLLASYAGAVLFVWIATNVTRHVTGYDARWVALAWACVVQLLVWLFVMGRSVDALALALVNVLVVYAGATGTASIAGSTQPITTRSATTSFWARWW